MLGDTSAQQKRKHAGAALPLIVLHCTGVYARHTKRSRGCTASRITESAGTLLLLASPAKQQPAAAVQKLKAGRAGLNQPTAR